MAFDSSSVTGPEPLSPFSSPFGSTMGNRTLLLYMLRHGQSFNTNPTEENPSPVNPPLTPVGQRQVELLAQRVRTLRPDRLISSPMLRTMGTAAAIRAATGLPLEVWARGYEFRATHGYRCQGAPQLRSLYPECILPPDFSEEGWDYGNEALDHALQRAGDFLRFVEAGAVKSGYERVLVASHGTFTRLALCHIFNCELDGLRRLWFDNSAVNTLQLTSAGFRVLGLNDTSHLIGQDGLDPVAGVTR
jgi:broad specificity phosphatase PhoE